MEIKREPNQCRLCFLPADYYINILENTSSTPNMIEALQLYFSDEVNEMDELPKIICVQCWKKVEDFHDFTEQVVRLREDFLNHRLNNAMKQEYEEQDTNDFDVTNDIEMLKETICIEPVNSMDFLHINDIDEGKEFDWLESNGEQVHGVNHEDDDEDSNDNDSDGNQSDITDTQINIVHTFKGEHILLPTCMDEVSLMQKQQVLKDYFDMSCDHCDEKFQEFENASKHYKDVHQNLPEGYVKCTKCDKKVLKERKKFHDHILWHLNPTIFKCTICKLTFKSRQTLSSHRSLHKAKDRCKYQCDICKKRFGRRDLVISHVLNVHAARMQFQCPECHTDFESRENLDDHVNVAHNRTAFNYSIDDIKLTGEEVANVLSEHFDLTCTEDGCDATFESLPDAKQHYSNIHGMEGFLRCCQSRFFKQRFIDDHIAWHLNPNIFRCKTCWKTFKWRLHLIKHELMHKEKQLICKICKERFKKQDSYNLHMKKNHSKADNYKCDFCEKRFSQRSNMVEHIKVIHEPEFEADRKKKEETEMLKKYFDLTCDWEGCDEVFDSLEMAQSHYRDSHGSTEFYIKCCGVRFNEQNLVRDHIALHLNPELFKCVHCGECCRNRKSYYYHAHKHRNLTEKKFKCDICSKTFVLKTGVQEHILTTHVKKQRKCTLCEETFTTRDKLEEHFSVAHSNSSDDFLAEIKCIGRSLSREKVEEIIKANCEKSCDLCGVEIDSFQTAQKHYLMAHKIPNGYLKCCGMIFRKFSIISDHAHWHHDPEIFKCRLCQSIRNSRASLTAHMTKHRAVQLQSRHHSCQICKKAFAVVETYNKHMRTKHPELSLVEKSATTENVESSESKSDILCVDTPMDDDKLEIIEYPDYFDMTWSLCATVFARNNGLKEARDHYVHAHQIRTGFLRCCHVKLKSNTDIKDHIAWHSDPSIFKCKICNKTYCLPRLLKIHSYKHNDYSCNICGKTYTSVYGKNAHMKIHEKRERNNVCQTCNKGFYSEKELRGHIQRKHTSDKQHICEICAKGFGTKPQLINHLKIHSDTNLSKPKKKYQCNICNGWYSSKICLGAHMARHSATPVKCDQCDKISPNKGALETHIRAVHCAAKFKCHLCDKSFKMASSLEGHIATHQDNRNYKCTYCDETFIWRPNMYKHRKNMHHEQWLADQTNEKD